MDYFTGIGATVLTPDEENFADELGYILAKRGLSLRSGKAPGADQRFQKGIERFMAEGDAIRDHQIFLPWPSFEQNNTVVSGIYDIADYTPEQVIAAETIAAKIHPVWASLTQGQRKFHMRNVFQALGLDCKTPSKLLIAIADTDGEGVPRGGTRTAYKIALEQNIPCINIRGLGRGIVLDWVNKYCPEEVV